MVSSRFLMRGGLPSPLVGEKVIPVPAAASPPDCVLFRTGDRASCGSDNTSGAVSGEASSSSFLFGMD